jgi:hypothetical protein
MLQDGFRRAELAIQIELAGACITKRGGKWTCGLCLRWSCKTTIGLACNCRLPILLGYPAARVDRFSAG